MATFTKLKSGSWRAQVRRKGWYVSETFLRREDARPFKGGDAGHAQEGVGRKEHDDFDRERLIRFGRKRAIQGAGPVTLSMDIGAIKLVLSHAAEARGLNVPVEPIDLARIALKRLGLVGNSNERVRKRWRVRGKTSVHKVA